MIIPYQEAAPTTRTDFFVGGKFRYSLDGNDVDIDLAPARIEVTPDPMLAVHYFWQRKVIGDDPFTDQVEPSLPFALVAAIKNFGHGPANEFRFSSGQPEIMENEKGLLVDFKLIGSEVDGKEVQPVFDLDLGNVLGGETHIVKWWLNCSLKGIFSNFSVSYTNKNPLGDPRLSIIEELKLHELFQQVRIGDRLDFLVREKKYGEIVPDHLVYSSDLSAYNVSHIKDIDVELSIGNKYLSAKITLTATTSGFRGV